MRNKVSEAASGRNNDEQDHAHEYIRPFAMMHILRFDGTISPDKYKFSLPASCVECGHVKRRNPSSVVEVEISPAEYKSLKNN